ncbi:MAG: alpha/beta hydrolase [Candidatus Omnitrophica bacterium]|nr:alpha/beta hydrolase [Candidatus Omnitrophota bacterium]
MIKVPSVVYIIFIGAVLIFVYARYIESRAKFFPTRELEFSPKSFGLEYEEVFFKATDNVELSGWFLPDKDARYTVLFFHGNAGNISHRLEKLKFFHDLGCNVFIVDYRGYGKSKGKPSEKGVYLDAQGAYDYLLGRNIHPEQIIGYGESIGGSVIIELASKNKLKALIVDSAFSNAKDMVRIIYPFLPYWIFSSRWDSLSKIKNIKTPKLFIHSINDEIVPYKLGRKIFEAAPEPKEFLQIHGGHNSGFYESETVMKEKVADFLTHLRGV